MRTRIDIADAMDYDEPNVYNTCQELKRKGIVERVPGSDRPARYRLTAPYRHKAG